MTATAIVNTLQSTYDRSPTGDTQLSSGIGPVRYRDAFTPLGTELLQVTTFVGTNIMSVDANSINMGTGVQTLADDGDVTAPGVASVQDVDTGLIWPGSDTLGIVVGSTESWRFLSSGALAAQGADRAIQNVLDPVNPQDAATMNYVDTTVAAHDLQDAYDAGADGEILVDATRGLFSVRDAATTIGVLASYVNNSGDGLTLQILANGSATFSTNDVNGAININPMAGLVLGSGGTDSVTIGRSDADISLTYQGTHNFNNLAGAQWTIDSTGDLVSQSANQILAADGSPTSASYGFAGGNAGFYRTAGNNIGVTIGAGARFSFGVNTFAAAIGSSGPMMVNENSTSTNPVFITQQGDATTGLGGNTGEISVILSGTEVWRYESTGVLSAQGGNRAIQNVLNPVSAQDAATKAYVDSIAQGIKWKDPVRSVELSSNITLSGTQTIGSVSLADGDRVLLTAQSSAGENGIWIVRAGAWERPLDFDTGDSASNATTTVEEGDEENGIYLCTTDAPNDVIDTDNLAFTKIFTIVDLVAGDGLVKTGQTLDVVANGDGSITVNANDIQVGVLATDAQHGVRGGGTQHAVATGSVAGFMSAADKTTFDSHLNPIDTTNPHSVSLEQARTVDNEVTGPIEAANGTAVLPSYAFATGNAGIFKDVGGNLAFSHLAAARFFIGGNLLGAAVSGSAPGMLNEVSTASNPVFVPQRGDTTTGIGGVAGTLSLITGGTGQWTVDASGNLVDPTAANLVDGRDVSVDGAALDAHLIDTGNPHSTDLGNLGTGTMAELRAVVTDATVVAGTGTDERIARWDSTAGDLQDSSISIDDSGDMFGVGGFSIYGGDTTAGLLLTLQGNSAGSGDVGRININSPVEYFYDTSSNTTPAEPYLIRWRPTASTGNYVGGYLRADYDLTATGTAYVPGIFVDGGTSRFAANPGFAAYTFINNLHILRNSGNFNLASALVNNIGIVHERNTSGTSTTSGSTGTNFVAQSRATVSGAILTKTTGDTGLSIAPTFSTVAGSTINMGTTTGLRLSPPSAALLQPSAGVENFTAYVGVDFLAMTHVTSGDKVVVRSAMTDAADRFFLQNNGGARSDFGGGSLFDCGFVQILADNTSLSLGAAGGDVQINWNGSALEFDPIIGDDMRISFATDVHTITSAAALAELRLDYDRGIHFGSGSLGNQIYNFAAGANSTQVNGEWATVLLTQAGNLTIDDTMSAVYAWALNSTSLTLGTGSITGPVSTFVVGGMTTSTLSSATSTQAMRVTGRSTFRGHLSVEELTPAALTVDVTDYQPATGNSARGYWRLTTDDLGAVLINSIAVLTPVETGDVLWITNVGTVDNITLVHQSGLGAAANDIISPTGANYVLAPSESAALIYDQVTTRWRILYGTGT